MEIRLERVRGLFLNIGFYVQELRIYYYVESD